MEQPNSGSYGRRELLGATAAIAAASSVGSLGRAQDESRGSLLERGDVVLFQGDSITDDGRSRETADEPNLQTTLGNGYAWFAASSLLVGRKPGRLSIYNRGVSGDRVAQLAARWEEDALALQPNLLSILVGVNDVWHVATGSSTATAETYAAEYTTLLERTREVLPDVKLVLCEPFVLRVGFVDDTWFPAFDEFRTATQAVAEQHAAAWVPFQSAFEEAVKYAPPEHWAADGVHPTAAGAALMAQTWLHAVRG